MFTLRVAAALASVFISQALPSMAASLHVPRGEGAGLISTLRRHPNGTDSVGRELHIRQDICTTGTYACALGGGNCCIGEYCVYQTGYPVTCCTPGVSCPITFCLDTGYSLCPGSQFCCPAGVQCLADFRCATGSGGSITLTTTMVQSTSGAPAAPTTPSTPGATTSANPAPPTSTGSGPATPPTNGGTMTASHSVVVQVCAAFVTALLSILN